MNDKLALLLDTAESYFKEIVKLKREHSLEDANNAEYIKISGAVANLRAKFRAIDDGKYKLEDIDTAIDELNKIIEEQKILITSLKALGDVTEETKEVDTNTMFVEVTAEAPSKHTLVKVAGGIALVALAAYGTYRLFKSK